MRIPVLFFWLLAALAQAQAPRMAALSDLQINIGAQCPKPDSLGTSFSALTNPDRDVETRGGQAALGQNIMAGLDESIRELEEELRDLEADDPSRPMLQQQLRMLQAQRQQLQRVAPSSSGTQPVPTQAAALANLKRALNAASGPGSVRLLETQPEYREASNASRTAALAAVMGKPQLALGLLLRAQALEPRNPAHLVNLAGLANYYGLFAEALALITAAERLNPPAALRPLLLNNKGHALMRLRRLPEAEAALRAAAQTDPNLQEARVNLAYTLGAQNKCAEAEVWARRAWWRHSLPGAENLETRPLAEAFSIVSTVPALPSLDFVPPGQTKGAREALVALFQEITNRRPKLEEFQAALAAQGRRRVEIASERRVGAIKAKFVEFLADALVSAARLNGLNDYAAAQGAALEAAQATLDRTVSELGTRFGANLGCASASAWREAALPAFQAADRALRALYAEAWRASATLATRFSEPTYRAVALLRLRILYYQAAEQVYMNGLRYVTNLELVQGLEDCGGGSANVIGSLATPQFPAACTPAAAPATPPKGWRLALSCDRTDFNFANPPWMDRYQILRDSLSPVVSSQLDARLAVFVPGGFVRLDAEGALMDAGLLVPSGNRNWRFMWNASSGSVGFASSEPQFGVK
jgi:tetratricopeptide (TPR) repeat protein